MSIKTVFISFFFLLLTLGSYSQTIAPPALQCVVNNNGNGSISLYWTDPANNPCGAFVNYTIYGSNNGPNGPYDSVITVNGQTTSTYTILNVPAGSTWYFYMVANYNCPGATVLHSDTVNNLNPATPVIVNVTVVNGKAVINWLPGASPNTAYYVIYRWVNGNVFPMDTVYGRSNTTTTDTLKDPTIQSLEYTIAAFDSCGSSSAYSTLPQQTIYTVASITECQRNLNISWNKYIDWPQGVAAYQLWMSKNGGPFNDVGTGDTANLVFNYTDFNDGDTLRFYIRATSAADTNIYSNSNVIVMDAKIVQPPSYIYITNLTVDNSNHIDITYTVDTIAQLIFFKFNRGAGDTLNLTLADQISAVVPLQHFQTLVDSNYISPQNNPYFYQVDAVDSCENNYLSPWGETVSLQGTLYDYYVAQLTWNSFYLQYATVLRYNLYRDLGTGAGFQLIKTFQPNVVQYFDSLQQFLGDKGTFCYRIEAVYYLNLPAPSGYQDTLTSWSNTVCVIHRPIIYIPNAFAPGGVNNIFKPTIIYGAPANYRMLIFNRWGAKIFESDDPETGWDGTDHGKELPLGGFAYLIQFTASDGTPIEEKGIVLLVR